MSLVNRPYGPGRSGLPSASRVLKKLILMIFLSFVVAAVMEERRFESLYSTTSAADLSRFVFYRSEKASKEAPGV